MEEQTREREREWLSLEIARILFQTSMNEEMPSFNSGEDMMNTKTEWKIIPQHCQNIRSRLAPVVISDSLIFKLSAPK